MNVVTAIGEARDRIRAARAEGKRIGFVPTMGYLHRGHLELVEISKRHSEYQVMSIFVNRIQFNDPKDFSSYPKDLQRDLDLARAAGVDLVFTPDEGEMYRNNLTTVDVSLLTDHLCGASRPGHFKGVFTVVSKLFNIIQPDVSIFGQKDIQQAVSIEKMVFDLNFPVKMIIAPTVREQDGLAMSSRNKHLDAEKRRNSVCIYRSLKRAEELLVSGETDSGRIRSAMEKTVLEGSPDRIDYISIVDYASLQPVERVSGKSVIAVAVFFGSTRLIDNMIIEFEGGGIKCVY
ncbi:MAG: pantoate--beta-alanine ligase [Spirochaetes bacterium]|jgi:pantoate--beta-alanine ligase|nr:pantoate--beta-alanine ligase [Spirochaetota bacterium]